MKKTQKNKSKSILGKFKKQELSILLSDEKKEEIFPKIIPFPMPHLPQSYEIFINDPDKWD